MAIMPVNKLWETSEEPNFLLVVSLHKCAKSLTGFDYSPLNLHSKNKWFFSCDSFDISNCLYMFTTCLLMKFQDKSLNVIKGELQDGIMISCNDSMEYWH